MRRAAVVVVAVLATCPACLTTYNRTKATILPDAPALDARPAGCNVDIVEDGQKSTRKLLTFGHLVLEWSSDKIKEQGPDGAMKTLREAACENGAFALTDMRGLPTGEGGLVYEADLATLLGDDGKPVNLKVAKPKPAAAAASPQTGW